MSLGPTLYPCTVDLDDGTLNHSKAQLHLSYSEQTGQVSRVQVHVVGAGNQITKIFDQPATELVEGGNPQLVAQRHQIRLADGRTMFILMERGSGCCGMARVLRGFVPGHPPTSGYRP